MSARIRTFRNANTPAPLKLPKGKLIKIEFGEHEQEMRIWEGKPPTKLIEKWRDEGIRINQEPYYNPGSMNSRMSKIQRL